MNQFDPEKKMEEMRKRQVDKKDKICVPDGMKACPFQSTPQEEVPCNHRCALFQSGKKVGYQCPLIELNSIGWRLGETLKRIGVKN